MPNAELFLTSPDPSRYLCFWGWYLLQTTLLVHISYPTTTKCVDHCNYCQCNRYRSELLTNSVAWKLHKRADAHLATSPRQLIKVPRWFHGDFCFVLILHFKPTPRTKPHTNRRGKNRSSSELILQSTFQQNTFPFQSSGLIRFEHISKRIKNQIFRKIFQKLRQVSTRFTIVLQLASLFLIMSQWMYSIFKDQSLKIKYIPSLYTYQIILCLFV